ncbi:MAG: GntR family transcriptional regulator [Hyphomicrobiales bacterium]|nr:GntR family transcriptional regulator [Hyphomicrobiales bacterium]
MVAIGLMNPSNKEKKLEAGQRKDFPPIRLDLTDGEKPKRKRGSARVYEELREDILWIRIEPGSVLDEVALAKRFDMSRTPIREALVMLQSDDLVTFLPNRTSIVAPHMLDNMNEHLDTHLLLARAVARMAAQFRTDENLEQIRNAASAYEKSLKTNDVYQIYGSDLALHRAISRSCHNHFTRKFHDLSLDCGRRAYVLHYYPEFREQERETSLAEHNELIAAIEDKDGDRADAAITRHVRSELNVIKRTLDPRVGFEMEITTGGTASSKG